MNNKTINGYPVDELIVFATACRKMGITEDELHEFVTNAKYAYDYVISEIDKSIGKFYRSNADTLEDDWAGCGTLEQADLI